MLTVTKSRRDAIGQHLHPLFPARKFSFPVTWWCHFTSASNIKSTGKGVTLTLRRDGYDGDQQDGAQRSQADGGEAVESGAARPGGQFDWEDWLSWR